MSDLVSPDLLSDYLQTSERSKESSSHISRFAAWKVLGPYPSWSLGPLHPPSRLSGSTDPSPTPGEPDRSPDLMSLIFTASLTSGSTDPPTLASCAHCLRHELGPRLTEPREWSECERVLPTWTLTGLTTSLNPLIGSITLSQ